MRWVEPATGKRVEMAVQRKGAHSPGLDQQWADRKERELMRVLVARSLGEPEPLPAVKIGDGVEAWLAAKPDLRPATAKWYRERMKVVAGLLPVETLDLLTPAAITGARDAVLARYPDAATANGFLRALRAACYWWANRGMVPDALTDRSIRVACEQLSEDECLPEPLSVEQIDGALWLTEGNAPELLPLLICALLVGHRARALLATRWEWFNLADRRLHYPAAVMKTGADCVVDLDLIGPEFVEWAGRMPRRGPLWDATGKHARVQLRKIERHGGPPVTLQRCRQTCATFLVATAGAYRESRQLAHGIQVAETRYVGLAPRAVQHGQTLVAAMGVAGYLGG